MLPYFENHYGNPSSLHRLGRDAKAALDKARESVASLIHADPRGIIFTSGGTEANNLALKGFSKTFTKPHVAISAVEHPSVLKTAMQLEKRGAIQTTLIPIGIDGCIDTKSILHDALPPSDFLSVMWGNNETGVLQPIQELAQANSKRPKEIPIHVDAVQALRYVDIDVEKLGLSMLSLSSHKLGGPKGVGALYLRPGLRFTPLIEGGAQERNLRAGTENLASIVGFGAACQEVQRQRDFYQRSVAKIRTKFESGLKSFGTNLTIVGESSERLPHITNVLFHGQEGIDLAYKLDTQGVAVSTGSACSSGSLDPSPSLLAMGLSYKEASSAVRFSFGPTNTLQEIDHVLRILEHHDKND